MTTQATRNNITLRGSTDIVTEFFGYSINSILYQRGLYPPEYFTRVNKYGLTMLVTTDEGLKDYLKGVLSQISEWLVSGNIQKLVLVINDIATKEVLERWNFDIVMEKPGPGGTSSKPEKEIRGEIQAIIRQITASVTFLPLLPFPCAFDLLVHTNPDIKVPGAWEESDPKYITSNSQEVRLRSFTTSIHKVDSMVAFKGS